MIKQHLMKNGMAVILALAVIAGGLARGEASPAAMTLFVIENQELTASDAAAGDGFGNSAALDGNTLVVGASSDDGTAGTNQGSAYVFVNQGGTWAEQQKLIASDAAVNDRFGDSVAISGETIVVGAFSDDGAAGMDQGAVYVFVNQGGTWLEQQKLTALDGAAGDRFGVSVVISGESIIVGALFDDDTGGANQGAAYVFINQGGTWIEQQKLTASDAAQSDAFGVSVAMSGESLIVGASLDDDTGGANQGAAYVFVNKGGTWVEQQKLTASDAAADDRFGGSVAIAGETIVVGASNTSEGAAYVFVNQGDTWAEQQKLIASDGAAGDFFGSSIAIDGEKILIGADDADYTSGEDQGAAYLFINQGGTWIEQQKLTASDAAAGDNFGSSLALGGETIIVGALFHTDAAGEGQGSAYIFNMSPFDICLQDDSDPSRTLKWNSITGDYVFSCGVGTPNGACDEIIIAGKGTVGSKKGKLNLIHITPTRRVRGFFTPALSRGSGAVQMPPSSFPLTVNDSDTTDNDCP